MVRIRRFSVIRTATVVALMYVIAIAAIGIPVVLLLLAVGSASDSAGGTGVLFIGGALGIVFFAIIYGVLGWVFTAVACLLYNTAARFTGGIEVQVERLEPPSAAQTVPDWVPQSPSS